ncbi:MAG: hypothetical protein R3307_08305, partial [Anaerolineales bacterium]|nr:hypothetical protein [Anaerolineales bacterium]
RVDRRLGKRARKLLNLEDFSKAELQPLYTPRTGTSNLLRPPKHFSPLEGHLLLAEIPSNFNAIKSEDFPLSRDWRFFSREVFETAFDAGYIVTDFIYENGRSFYVLTNGESTLQS